MTEYILAIDQGTTTTRAILFDAAFIPIARHEEALQQIYPQNGWIEHDALKIWEATQTCCREVIATIDASSIAAIGITNQRETTVLWDRKTGIPLHNAIVWQDRRTAEHCQTLRTAGHEVEITAKTGLLLDPYFSATKAQWLLDNIPGARERAAQGELALGTIDSYLIYQLTGGQVHATDVTNASRTMLFNLHSLDWDESLLELFNVPRTLLPKVLDSDGDFGVTQQDLFGVNIPIRGVAGDQQAALFGHACFAPGDVKFTFGTGGFMLVNTGDSVITSNNRLLATCGYRAHAKTAYAIEGSIFIAGAVVQWLRDALGVIPTSAASEQLAQNAKPTEGLYFVPAFTGLGAPYWDPHARGAILGLTRDMGAAEITRAALEAVCFEARDLLEAIRRDMRADLYTMKVDGGMVTNDWFCQRLADLTGLIVERSAQTDTTALGAAMLAGLSRGLSTSPQLDRRFEPGLSADIRDQLYAGWNKAVARIRG